MEPLIGLTASEISEALDPFGEPAFRGRQLAAWIYRRRAASFDLMTDLPKGVRAALADRFAVRTLQEERAERSPDGAVKHAFRLRDDNIIEAVYLPYADRVSVCLSTQVGCPAACAFCATGRLGLIRQLTAGEIVEQWLALNDGHPNRRITHAVFMGMGEPLLNYEAVVKAVRILHAEVQVSMRNITISTVGVAPGIRKLAAERLPVNLAVSLHAPTDDLRATIVPTARQWPLKDILEAARHYRDATGRDVTYEYVLLAGVNDSDAHARGLVELLDRDRGSVNLIPYNPVDRLGRYRTPDAKRVREFKEVLRSHGRAVTERQRRGRGAHAACGQLAGAPLSRRASRVGALAERV